MPTEVVKTAEGLAERRLKRFPGYVEEVFDIIRADIMSLRIPPDTRISIESLVREDQLRAFVHAGFWHPMDTLRDKLFLEECWASGRAEWKTW